MTTESAAMAAFDRLARWAAPYVPFTAPYELRRAIRSSSGSILDVGCGPGHRMAFIRERIGLSTVTVGVDIYSPYLRQAAVANTHHLLVQGDVRSLPFREKSFHIVLCLEVIEHLEKQEAIRLISDLERIARKRVVLSVPIGDHEQDAYDGNPNQEHRSTWSLRELEALGFQARITGIRNAAGERGFLVRTKVISWPLTRLLSVLAVALIATFFPAAAGHTVCWKKVSAAPLRPSKPC